MRDRRLRCQGSPNCEPPVCVLEPVRWHFGKRAGGDLHGDRITRIRRERRPHPCRNRRRTRRLPSPMSARDRHDRVVRRVRAGRREPIVTKRFTPHLLARVGAEVVGTSLFFAALVHLEFATAQTILLVVPFAVTLAAALVLGETVSTRQYLTPQAAVCISSAQAPTTR